MGQISEAVRFGWKKMYIFSHYISQKELFVCLECRRQVQKAFGVIKQAKFSGGRRYMVCNRVPASICFYTVNSNYIMLPCLNTVKPGSCPKYVLYIATSI